MADMVDIHCHALPAVDDGAQSTEVALEMLRRGLGEGIGAVVLTPHLKPEDGPEKEGVHRERFAGLQQAVQQEGLAVEMHLGAEIGFRFGLTEAASWPSGHLAGGPYVLVDLPPGPLSPGLEQGFFELRAAGFRPILAHPERHRQLALAPEQMRRLRQQELLIQINSGSLLGRFGRRAQTTAELLLERGWAELVASDGHDLDKRPLSLAQARAQVAARFGPAEAERLFGENPRRVLRGQEMEPARRPRRPRRPGLLARLVSRLG